MEPNKSSISNRMKMIDRIITAYKAKKLMLQAQQVQQTAKTVDPRWSNQGPTVVHEMPWHKAHPGLKNVQ